MRLVADYGLVFAFQRIVTPMARGNVPKTSVSHDKMLFEQILAEAKLRNPEVRAGSMFGSPALFLGRRMIGCVFGSTIGLKVPAAVAAEALARGSARPFRPYGKPAMREWIEFDGNALTRHVNLLEQAIRFAALETQDG
jgi:TfoX/Sxy family transcriptional regulator of competence genes